jgi:hypothetical protein
MYTVTLTRSVSGQDVAMIHESNSPGLLHTGMFKDADN